VAAFSGFEVIKNAYMRYVGPSCFQTAETVCIYHC